MAPVAADIAQAEQDGLAQGAGFGQGVRAPFAPFDQVVGMRGEKGAAAVVEAHCSIPGVSRKDAFPPARFCDVFGAGLLISNRGLEKEGPQTPAKGAVMKVTMEMDMTPEEARAFMGLPDVAPMQKKMLEGMQARMKAAFDTNDPEGMMRAWMPFSQGMGGGADT